LVAFSLTIGSAELGAPGARHHPGLAQALDAGFGAELLAFLLGQLAQLRGGLGADRLFDHAGAYWSALTIAAGFPARIANLLAHLGHPASSDFPQAGSAAIAAAR
jgi:hypothetical protein